MKITSGNIASLYGNSQPVSEKRIKEQNTSQNSSPVQEKVELSSLKSAESFDAQKVADLKAKIQSGEYKPDVSRIAQKIMDTYK